MRSLPAFILGACLFSAPALAGSNATQLLGVVPGQPSPFRIEPFTPASPFGIFRIPTASPELARVFTDIEFMVLSSNGHVAGVGARRAYPTAETCNNARAKVQALLKDAFGQKYSGPDPRWQFQSADGGITAGALCERAAGSPYPVLVMDITHTATNGEILKYFNRVPARHATEKAR